MLFIFAAAMLEPKVEAQQRVDTSPPSLYQYCLQYPDTDGCGEVRNQQESEYCWDDDRDGTCRQRIADEIQETANKSDLWCREQLVRNRVPLSGFALERPCSALAAYESGEAAKATADYGSGLWESVKEGFQSPN